MTWHNDARHITPPGTTTHLQPYSTRHQRSLPTSADSPATTSPDSVRTPTGTPPRSPNKHTGPALLPKIRKQDQILDPINIPHVYRRFPVSFSTTYPAGYDSHFTIVETRGRSLSPPEGCLITPVSAITSSSNDSPDSPSTEHLLPSHANVPYSRSTAAPYMQARSKSASMLDEGFVRHYPQSSRGPMPVYLMPTSQAPGISMQSHPTIAIPSHMQITHSQAHAPPQQHQATPAHHSPLSAELLFENYSEIPPTTTLLDYLTGPNPSPPLVRHAVHQSRVADMHFWWDIRNIVAWRDFNLGAINQIPDLATLLNLSIPSPALPTSERINPSPETLSALHDMHTFHFATKINAALKVALGHPHLTMLAQKVSLHPGAPKHIPDFVANYSYDAATGFFPANPQARVIGLVRTYETWNSGMRSSNPTARISYLRELAYLQHHMRAHGCRYGFILSEIELVCVRMGSLPSSAAPVFGLLELAEPVQLATHGRPASMASSLPADAKGKGKARISVPSSGSITPAAGGLTAGLALWYLHMLAKNEPLPGQCGWRIDVGPPAALSRRNVLPKDAGWISGMKPEGREKRDAKRNRG